MSSQQPTKPPDPQKPVKHVDILQSQYSHLFANLHPVLLLSLVPFSFKSLVNDPVNTLLGLAPTVALVQAIYCIVCLPSTGQTPPPAHKPGQKKKIGKPVQDIWANVVVRLRTLPTDLPAQANVPHSPQSSPFSSHSSSRPLSST